MPTIATDNSYQTVITTFEMTPATADDLKQALNATFTDFVSKQPGFVGAGLHVNDARTRIATYSQWQNREDFQAMMRSPEFRECQARIADLCKSFEPVMYDVFEAIG